MPILENPQLLLFAEHKKNQTFYKLFDRYIQIVLAIGSVLSIKEFLFVKKYNFFNIVKIRYVPAEKNNDNFDSF